MHTHRERAMRCAWTTHYAWVIWLHATTSNNQGMISNDDLAGCGRAVSGEEKESRMKRPAVSQLPSPAGTYGATNTALAFKLLLLIPIPATHCARARLWLLIDLSISSRSSSAMIVQGESGVPPAPLRLLRSPSLPTRLSN